MRSDIKTLSTSQGSFGRVIIPMVPNPEVIERPKRRTYTAEYKIRILKEVDAITETGEFGALLRREGLFRSYIATWRWQREKGELEALSSKKRGPKITKSDSLSKIIEEKEKEIRKLQRRLKHAELIINFQKKISEIMGIPLKDIEIEGEDL